MKDDGTMFEVRNLSSAYGQSEVLHGIDLAVKPGEIVALVGRNGMGKSTLMKSLIGVMPARSGQIVVDGTDVTALAPHQRVACGLAYVPQGRQIFGTMTVKENIETGLVVTGKQRDPARRSSICFRSWRISRGGAAAISRAASSSNWRSRGRWRAIRRSCCSTSRPKASSRRSSRISRGCCATSASIRNLCIVVCEQVLSFVLDVADRIFVMEGGRIVHTDSREHVDEAAIARFLAV